MPGFIELVAVTDNDGDKFQWVSGESMAEAGPGTTGQRQVKMIQKSRAAGKGRAKAIDQMLFSVPQPVC